MCVKDEKGNVSPFGEAISSDTRQQAIVIDAIGERLKNAIEQEDEKTTGELVDRLRFSRKVGWQECQTRNAQRIERRHRFTIVRKRARLSADEHPGRIYPYQFLRPRLLAQDLARILVERDPTSFP